MTLPTPDAAFHWSAEPWGHALRCRPLDAIAQHAFTTRQLKLRAPDEQTLAWTQAVASVGAGLEQLMRIKQVHGRSVRVLRRGEVGPQHLAECPAADAVVSNEPDLVLAVQTADCVPILIADRDTGVVAAIHAGWRGTNSNITGATVELLAREFGAKPSQLIAAIGPSIGPCCYTVGVEVVDAFRAAGATEAAIAHWFSRPEAGPLRLDLWEVNRDQLRDAGVKEEHIHLARLCTQTHLDTFDSFRAEGDRAGRMAALIKVPK
jgi:YfiH family protein